MFSYRTAIGVFSIVIILAAASSPTHTPTPSASHSAFRLPVIPGVTVNVTQGNNQGDHIAANGSEYAFDFIVGQSNFVVTAAQGGQVIGVNNSSTIQCSDANTESAPKQMHLDHCWTYANFVLIANDDGKTAALYVHLLPYSDKAQMPKVAIGDHVNQGDSLGLAGTTGWSTGIHLHFQVEEVPSIPTHPEQSPDWWWTNSLPTSFSNPEVLAKDACLSIASNGIPQTGQCFVVSNPPTPTTVPMPPTQTNCPAAGTARAAVTAPLVLGTHQNLIYSTRHEGEVPTYNPSSPSSDTLKRYDVATGQMTSIVNLDTSMATAQISADGQWALFATIASSTHPQSAIQIIRMDGQGLQTLYCAPPQLDQTNFNSDPIYAIAWSANQQLVMFSEADNSNNPPSLYLLNLVNGNVQKELQSVPGSSTSYYPHLWIDNTHVALLAVDSVNGSEDDGIYLLDTNGGANQQNSDLQLIAKDSTLFAFDFDINPDHTAFVTGKSSNVSPFTSSISVLPIIGGSEHTIYTSQAYQVVAIRVVSNTTVLFYLLDPSGTLASDQSGLYKIHLDGTGFTKLNGNNIQNGGGYLPVIDVSQDRNMYAVELSGIIGGTGTCGQQCGYSLIRFGSLNGGTPTTIPDTNSNLSLVGWTTM